MASSCRSTLPKIPNPIPIPRPSNNHQKQSQASCYHPTTTPSASYNVVKHFFQRFPEQVSFKQIGDRFKIIRSLFVSKRKTKSGRRFGFVTLGSATPPKELVPVLNRIWFGSFKLMVNQVKYERKAASQNRAPTRGREKKAMTLVPLKERDTRTYAEVVGKRSKQTVLLQMPLGRGIAQTQILDHSLFLIQRAVIERSLVGVVSKETHIGRLRESLLAGGINDCKVVLMGGWSQAVITFPNCDLLDQAMESNSDALGNLFDDIRPTVDSDRAIDSLCWLEISGLPLYGWCTDLLQKIIHKVGVFRGLHVDSAIALFISMIFH